MYFFVFGECVISLEKTEIWRKKKEGKGRKGNGREGKGKEGRGGERSEGQGRKGKEKSRNEWMDGKRNAWKKRSQKGTKGKEGGCKGNQWGGKWKGRNGREGKERKRKKRKKEKNFRLTVKDIAGCERKSRLQRQLHFASCMRKHVWSRTGGGIVKKESQSE